VSALHQSGVDFIACDNPNANRLTIQILAAVAENEARVISERTKAALAAAKARGTLLGASRVECRNFTPEAGLRGAKRSAIVRRDRSAKLYADLLPEVAAMRSAGQSLRAIASVLNSRGDTTVCGAAWNATQVRRLAQPRAPS
jgi:DNA invertase Pin-like site-specific DNA recombinase